MIKKYIFSIIALTFLFVFSCSKNDESLKNPSPKQQITTQEQQDKNSNENANHKTQKNITIVKPPIWKFISPSGSVIYLIGTINFSNKNNHFDFGQLNDKLSSIKNVYFTAQNINLKDPKQAKYFNTKLNPRNNKIFKDGLDEKQRKLVTDTLKKFSVPEVFLTYSPLIPAFLLDEKAKKQINLQLPFTNDLVLLYSQSKNVNFKYLMTPTQLIDNMATIPSDIQLQYLFHMVNFVKANYYQTIIDSYNLQQYDKIIKIYNSLDPDDKVFSYITKPINEKLIATFSTIWHNKNISQNLITADIINLYYKDGILQQLKKRNFKFEKIQ